MFNFLNLSIFVMLVFIFQKTTAYDWHEESDCFWAPNCDWSNNDLSSKQIKGEQCSGECGQTAGCTHFTWTEYQGGTCWMKKNPVSKDQATPINGGVCGVMKSSSPPPSGAGGQVKTINRCSFPVWVGAFGQQSVPENGGWKLEAGQEKTVTIGTNGRLWSGRFWGRTDCNDQGQCSTGRCSGLQCKGTTGEPPASLAEITFNGAGGQDFYDVSLVDGYNLPIKMRPIAGTFNNVGGDPTYDCKEAGCDSDLNAICPAELKLNVGGRVVGCKSACEAFHKDEFCCKGAHSTPQTCPATDYSRKFKQACPRAYSYAYDDATSTFRCKGKDNNGASYEVQFC